MIIIYKIKMTTNRGKCWIYKRATLHMPNAEPELVDYSNGTESFDVGDNDVVFEAGDYPKYLWNLPGTVVPISLNVPSSDKNITSIYLSGVIPYGAGQIEWECLYGKYKPYHLYVYHEMLDKLPIIMVFIIFLCILRR